MAISAAHVQYVFLAAASIWAFKAVSKIVPEPYLDEVFHIPQTRQYCKGNWTHWDNKITTPPGLYALGVLYSNLVAVIKGYSDHYCTTDTLRNLNLVGVLVGLPLAVYKTRLQSVNFQTSVSLASYPLITFFGLLYYTDVWSTIFVVSALAIGSRGTSLGYIVSAVFALVSLTFRQTNIVWAGFVAIMLAGGQPTLSFSPDSVVVSLFEQVSQMVKRLINTPSLTVSYGAVAVAFAGFVHWNGSIALGDKSNHGMTINVPQLFYCSLFWAMFSWPLWFGPRFIRRYVASNFGSPLRVVRYVVLTGLIAAIIDQLTIVHAFMLADNRHYTFYIWRRFIDPHFHHYAKFGLVPVYHMAMWAFTTSLYANTSPIVGSALILATAACIVPSPLFESRYYIMTYVFWRMMVRRVRRVRLWAEWGYYMLVNCVTLYMFLYRPFTWENEPGNLQRFMW